ncbi:MAG: two-component regulator propeller domain-containing protein [Bacteroidales bacterium]
MKKTILKYLAGLLILCCHLFVFTVPANSQNYTIRRFTTENGLSHNNVRTMAMDSTGFLWIATWDGLGRFDGYQFKNYYHIPGDTTTIPYFSIQNLYVDRRNFLWIFTDKSDVSVYDRRTDMFRTFRNLVTGDENRVYNLCVDNNGDVWIITSRELLKHYPEKGSFKRYGLVDADNNPFELPFFNLFNIDVIDGNKVWLTGRQIYECEIEENSIADGSRKVRVQKEYKLNATFFNDIIDFDHLIRFNYYKSKSGNSWIFSNIGLFRLDPSTSSFNEYRGNIIPGEFTGRRYFDWAWSDDGIYSYDTRKRKLRHILPGDTRIVKGITHQHGDLIWFSSTSRAGTPFGLSYIIFTNPEFKFHPVPGGAGELPAVFAVLKDKEGFTWAGARGLDHLEKAGPDGRIMQEGKLDAARVNQSGHVRAICQTDSGLWIGYYTRLLRFYDFRKKTFKDHFPGEATLRTMITSDKGSILFGTSDLFSYNPSTMKTSLFWKSGWKESIYKLLPSGDTAIWIGSTTKHLARLNLINGRASIYNIQNEDYHVEDIIEDADGSVWCATLGGGVIHYFPLTGESSIYTTSSGLSNNTTYSLLKDSNGSIWVSSNNGISMINRSSGQIRIFDESDGVKINEFNSDAVYKDKDGYFYFGGMGGYTTFHPDSVLGYGQSEKSAGILISELRVSGKRKVLEKSIDECDTLLLDAGENNFSLRFGTTDFASWERTMYRYRFEPGTGEWIETDHNNRSINFFNLNPGKYRLTLQATDKSGYWNIISRTITIIVTPSFRQTVIFKILLILLACFFLMMAPFIYMRNVVSKNRQANNLLKLQALRGQMNPHFIFNSLNSINYFISRNDRLSANRYIGDFSRLIRSILSNMGKDWVPFEAEVESLRDYLKIEYLRFGDKFEYDVVIEGMEGKQKIEVFPGLVQPFVENAIWHGVRSLEKRKANIVVRFSMPEKDFIRCRIVDDGIGRLVAEGMNKSIPGHESRGIALVKERLNLISRLKGRTYSLVITDLYPGRFESGTIVDLDIPLR